MNLFRKKKRTKKEIEQIKARVRNYRNRDKRCTYPYEMSPLGYCWSYATFKDDGKMFLEHRRVKSMIEICRGCELWKE